MGLPAAKAKGAMREKLHCDRRIVRRLHLVGAIAAVTELIRGFGKAPIAGEPPEV